MQSGSDYDEDDVEHNSRPSRVSSRVLTRTRSNPPPRLNSRPSRVGRSSSRQDSIDFEGEVEGDGDGAEEDQDEDQEEGEIEEAEDDEEPAEIGSDIDAINSGAVTPALGGTSSSAPGGVKKGKHPQFLARKKETKTIKGQVYTILDDELMLEDDARGEAKIDNDGHLLDGREYKVTTFTCPHRANPNKLYMLSIDAARAAGYRDSLYFFRRNPLMHKLSCSQSEKDRLIADGRISSNLKSRAVTMVSAKNCFKVMGAAFVKDGKHVFDDYYEDKALASGHKPGEPAFVEPYDPEKDSGTLAASKGAPPPGATSTGVHVPLAKPRPPPQNTPAVAPRDDFLSLGSSVAFGGSGLQPFGKTWDPAAKKAKPAAHLTVVNWMEQYAKSVGERNRALAVTRKMNLGQVQVGVGVVEREEDLWTEIEEEVEEDEENDGDEDEEVERMAVDPKSEPSDVGAIEVASLSERTQIASAPANLDSSTVKESTPTQGGTKRKLIKVYNPIRGIYDPETNVPHVYKETQPTEANTEEIDALPELELELDEPKRRKLAKAGFASLSFVADLREKEGYDPTLLLPGMWDFGAGPSL